MARRKRLSPMPMTAPKIDPGAPGPLSPRRPAPIADVTADASASAAAEEMAAALEAARSEGRMAILLPLDAILEGYLVRDRIADGAGEDEDMAALKASIAARGQQVPIEVARIEGGGYGLISGWRRLTALKALLEETGEARFGEIRAVLRRPEDAAAAYLAMVEENEIRVGLSYYERALIVARSVEQGVFPDRLTALQALFASASRPRRSKIGSFAGVVAALDGALRYPRAIGERLGLRLSRALEADPGLGARIRADLASAPAGSAAAELERLDAALSPEEGVSRAKRGDPAGNPGDGRAPPATRTPVPGVTLTVEAGRLTMSGTGVDAALADRLDAWLKDTLGG